MTKEVTEYQPGSMMAIIERAVSSPNIAVESLERMLSMQERIMEKNAEIAFNQAMTRLQPKLPIIKHDSKIAHGGKTISTYAKYEAIDVVIRPLYVAEGFSLSFDSKKNTDGSVTYFGTISHEAGHSRTAEMVLPADKSGAKNEIQAIGSTISYAKRYLVGMLMNLVTAGEDDGGEGIKFVSHEQAVEIDLKIVSVKADKVKFLALFGVDDVRHIRESEYKKAIALLNKKQRASA